jgi:hypothetical protein
MKRKMLLTLTLLAFVFVGFGCALTPSLEQKPILTMTDVKKLGPKDLGEFAIQLYNERAEWYKFQMSDPSFYHSEEQKETLRDEYDLLLKSWQFIYSYDSIASTGKVPSQKLRLEIYKFIQKFIGG